MADLALPKSRRPEIKALAHRAIEGHPTKENAQACGAGTQEAPGPGATGLRAGAGKGGMGLWGMGMGGGFMGNMGTT